VILRLVLGFAETVAHPASIGFIQRNFRGAEQGLPTSIYLAGMQVGPALGALLGSWLLQSGGWRWLFVVTGLGACVWLVPWLALVPAESRYKSMQRSIYMATAPSFWFRLFTTPLVAGVLLGAFFYSYYWFFCLTWLPSYLVIARGFSFLKMGTFTALPLTGMAIVSIFSARVADRIIARIDRPLLVRKAFVVSGFVLGSSILALPLLVSSFAVLTVMLSSSVGIGIASANFWAIVQIISPQAMIGRVIGVQNTIASVAGICAPLVTGLLVDRMKRFDLAIVVAGLSLLLAAACFAFLVREKDAQELHRRFC
jgi:ACS family D-galactonate transporter-like MFS transporter